MFRKPLGLAGDVHFGQVLILANNDDIAQLNMQTLPLVASRSQKFPAVCNTLDRARLFLHSAPENLNRTACPKNTTLGASGNRPTINDDGDGLDKEPLMMVHLVFRLISVSSLSYMPHTRMISSQACHH